MNNKNIAIAAVAILVTVFGIGYLKQTTVTNVINVPPQEARSFGATPGNSVDGGYYSIGGQQFFRMNYSLLATSSAICSVLNPFAPATTTVITGGTGLVITAGLLGANTFDLSTSSTAYASSSPAFARGVSIGSGAEVTYVFTPHYGTTTATTVFTPTNVGTWQIADTVNPDYPYILKGSEYLTWKVASGTPGVGTWTGSCNFYGVKT